MHVPPESPHTVRAAQPGSPLVNVDGLSVHFPVYSGLLKRRTGAVKAVDGLTFAIRRGETFALVGESGCGKSTTGRALLRLTQITKGRVDFDQIDLTALGDEALRRMRPRMQMIFQDPQACLNPRMTVGSIIAEPLAEHTRIRGKARNARVRELLDAVGLSLRYINRYPHEFSGGQRQRIGIARALALNPDFIVCDEPIAALDVSIQAQVVNLLKELRASLGLTYLFISHDLSMVRYIANRVAVMYLGKIVEIAEVGDLFANPRHPYTKALLSAVPVPDPEKEANRRRIVLSGDLPDPANAPVGCRFSTRCPYAVERCHVEEPLTRDFGGGHMSACHFA